MKIILRLTHKGGAQVLDVESEQWSVSYKGVKEIENSLTLFRDIVPDFADLGRFEVIMEADSDDGWSRLITLPLSEEARAYASSVSVRPLGNTTLPRWVKTAAEAMFDWKVIM